MGGGDVLWIVKRPAKARVSGMCVNKNLKAQGLRGEDALVQALCTSHTTS
jgi:hypothetical protein